MSKRDFHLLKIKAAMSVINESLTQLFNESILLPGRNRPRLKETEDFYNIRELPGIVGLSRSTIYLKIKNNTFPKPIRLSESRISWRKVDIHKWLDKKKQGE